jgi:hypothetical protein
MAYMNRPGSFNWTLSNSVSGGPSVEALSKSQLLLCQVSSTQCLCAAEEAGGALFTGQKEFGLRSS